jgi:hypothetical protein
MLALCDGSCVEHYCSCVRLVVVHHHCSLVVRLQLVAVNREDILSCLFRLLMLLLLVDIVKRHCLITSVDCTSLYRLALYCYTVPGVALGALLAFVYCSYC